MILLCSAEDATQLNCVIHSSIHEPPWYQNVLPALTNEWESERPALTHSPGALVQLLFPQEVTKVETIKMGTQGGAHSRN